MAIKRPNTSPIREGPLDKHHHHHRHYYLDHSHCNHCLCNHCTLCIHNHHSPPPLSSPSKPSNGQPSNGQPSKGQPSNGQPSDGQPFHAKRPSFDMATRSSFSSVREGSSVDGLVQSFTQSKISSLDNHHGGLTVRYSESAIEDASSPVESELGSEGARTSTSTGAFAVPLTRPNSRLHGVWCPAPGPGLRSWKQIAVRGRKASRSLEDIRSQLRLWEEPLCEDDDEPQNTTGKKGYPPGMAPIERLPLEILASILRLLFVELPTNGVTTRNQDLMSMLRTSRALYTATIGILYQHVTIPHSRIFRKFLSTIEAHPSLAAMTRRLDFSHFNPSSVFGSASERARATNLTTDTLARCLDLAVNLQEFLAQEHVDDDLGPQVIHRLFTALPRMQALDFAGCSSPVFNRSFSAAALSQCGPWPDRLSVTRLSLHKCRGLPSAVFDAMLPRLANLSHLDLAATRVTDAALRSIPHTARLTHLNLAKCRLLTTDAVIGFVASHPAARSLVVLSLAQDSTSHELLDHDAVTRLLPVLPRTLKSLSLKGSRMSGAHMALLEPLTRHLEELALGRHLCGPDLQHLLGTLAVTRKEGEHARYGNVKEKADAKDGATEPPPVHTLRYLDLTDLTADELSVETTFSDPASLLGPASLPLEVIELAETSHKRLARARAALESTGWKPREVGARAWLVRASEGDSTGYRWWKMGAESWGTRKIPVAQAEVGGMYGLFMFGQKL